MKPLGVGAKVGGGIPPGYAWNVFYIPSTQQKLAKIFDKHEYEFLYHQMLELAREEKPSHPIVLDVRQVEDYYELREKGGPLRSTNARIFFYVDADERAIIVLHGCKKQNNGKTPQADKLVAEQNLKLYRRGAFQIP